MPIRFGTQVSGTVVPISWDTGGHREGTKYMKLRFVRIATAVGTLTALAVATGAPRKFH